jgi:predicted RNA-binding Zn ribbon-like protein
MAKSAQPEETPRDTSANDAAPAGVLALAAINTQVIERGKRRDLLSSPEALARWWAEACQQYPDQCLVSGAAEPIAWTGELLEAVKELRSTLGTILTHMVEQQVVAEEDLRPVNAILALGYSVLQTTGQGGVKTVLHLRDPERGRVLVPIARSALQLFTEVDVRRLHQCASDRCILFFYDTTKSGTRRWCSPGCMNRARSIRHYQQAKNAGTEKSRIAGKTDRFA